MKKLLLLFFAMFAAFSFAAASEQMTPASIYAKVIAKSYAGKYQSIIIPDFGGFEKKRQIYS